MVKNHATNPRWVRNIRDRSAVLDRAEKVAARRARVPVRTIDALAFEPHFLDHLTPLWRGLAPELRGRFLVDASLVDRGADAGLDVEAIDARAVRRSSRYADADPGDGPVALVASYGDIKVGRRLGYRRFAFLEHGAGQAYLGDRRHRRHGSYAGGEDREDVGLFLVPNEYAGALWTGAYPGATVEVVGCPKLSTLPRREPGPGPVVAISFHWEAHIIPEARSAFGYFRSVLPDLARRYTIIGHGHPRAADWLVKAYRRAGIPWVPEFADVCRQADLYVCDNSSTLFEFAATGRPVVVLNAPWYRRDVRHGLRFWEAASVGRQVDAPAELTGAIDAALADPSADQDDRDAALRLVYKYRDGAAPRAVAALEHWIRET